MRAPRPTLVSLALTALLATGCARTPEAEGRATDGPPVRVVLITLDTLRYDSFAGGDGPLALPAAMPRLAARAANGVSFSRFYVASSVTQPTHASLFTALHPWEHGVTRNGIVLGDDFPTIAEEMRNNGFETRAVVASFPCASRFGFGRGYDEYHEKFTTRFPGQKDWGGRNLPESGFFRLGDSVTEEAIAALDRATGRRQFFWFHYFDPHGPYGDSIGKYLVDKMIFKRIAAGRETDEVLQQARRYYQADVDALDQHLDRLLGRLESDEDEFETHIVLVADHGESLGEGGSVGHGYRLADCEIHVPCIILSPKITPGQRDDVAASVDVAPTLMSLAGLRPWEASGRDLTTGDGRSEARGMRRTFMRGKPKERRIDGADHQLEQHRFYAVDSGGQVRRGNAERLDGEDSPELRRLFESFQAQVESAIPQGELDPDVEEALRALGYVK